MSHISELYKKIEELQKQVDVIKEQNDKFQDIIDQAGGVLDDDLGTRINNDVKKNDNTKKDDGSAPAPAKPSGGCGVKLSYKEQTVLKSITTQLRTKRIMTIKLLNYIDKMLKNDPHFVHQVNKEKTT
jgi:TolA-binding protein